jgi:hypothetical protein
MMPMPKNTNPRIWALSNAVCEGTITEQELQELESLLETVPDAKEFYADFLNINAELSWMVSAKKHSPMDLGPRSPVDGLAPINKSPVLGFLGSLNDYLTHQSPISFALLLAVFGALFVTAAYLINHRDSDATQAEPVFVAHITAAKDCQWSMSTDKPADLEALEVGRTLNLEKGLVEITYANKAQVVIEGPACFTLNSPKSGYLWQGKLFAKADSKQSRQFTIVTPTARFVDLGTEFGVEVNTKGRSAVAVFSGKVNAAAKHADGSWTNPIPVAGGEAVICENEKFTSSVALRSDFPSMKPLPPPPPDANYQRWADAAKKLQSRQDLVAYYDFQPEKSNPKAIVNRALTGEAFDGIIHNASWTNGRFPGKKALEFDAADSGVRVNLPGEYLQMTVIVWVSSNQLANALNGILMSDDWDQNNKLHLQIDKNGKLILNVRGQVSMKVNSQEYHSTIKAIPADCLNKWCMIAGVIDSPNQCTIYINGEFFETLESTKIPPIRIGSALIGGWNRGNNPSVPENIIRNFSGRIDELMIFRNVLPAEDIKQIYESGKP